MDKPQTVMVLMGGWSSERSVSLTSGQAVYDALNAKGYTVIPFDPPHDLAVLDKTFRQENPDVVFNALHGVGGEDGVIQAALDIADIAYTHSSLTSSAVAMDKQLSKQLVSQAGVPVTKDVSVFRDNLSVENHPLPLPYVLKPIADGSSVGISIIRDDSDLEKAMANMAGKDMMAEKFIEGRELTVTVLDTDPLSKPCALCVTELKPQSGFYDFESKYTDGMTDHILDPDLPDDVVRDLLSYAVTAHTALKCNMLSRSDFRYNETDGIIYLETNTQPGMTSLSLVPEQAKHCGISFEDLIDQCVIYAFNKKTSSAQNKRMAHG